MDFFGDAWLATRVLWMVPLVLSLTVHEYAHAWCAFRLGDDTARRAGRLTLNPLDHLDPIGTLLPLLGVPFGWAKPVPVDPARARGTSMEMAVVLTAAAGPISNLLIAFAATLGLGLLARAGVGGVATQLLEMTVLLNLVLAVFNALPVPPLDGSRIVDGLCPDALRPFWSAVHALGPFALVAVLLVPLAFGMSWLDGPVAELQALLDLLYGAVAG